MATPRQLDAAMLQPLRERVRGRVLEPGQAGYDDARAVWNARIDRRPAAIVRCTSPGDVMAAVDFARERGLLLSVKSGGHDYAGNGVCDGGLTLDLSLMNTVHVQEASRRARVQPGATWAAFDREAQAAGLATTGGSVSTVGVAGFTLGGGSGHLARKFGLGLDNLVSAEVVTADGQLRHASEQENPDLFWALRGGGGNFGVVTSFEFRLHPFGPQMLCGQYVFPFEQAQQVFRSYRDFMASAPDEVTCYAFVLRIPPVEPFPPQWHGKVAVDLVASYAGPVAEGERAFQPLATFGTPILAGAQAMPYTAVQQMFDAGVAKGNRWYSRAHYLRALNDGVFDVVIRHTRELPGVFTMVYFEPLGGAVTRIAPEATAFPHRRAAAGIHIFPGWTDAQDDAPIMAWTREFHDALAPHADGGVYVNLLGDDEQPRVPAAYAGNYARLVELKKKWDPQNLFRVNHNIPPAK
jgi:FAD/FMN-containing dehydrogenase